MYKQQQQLDNTPTQLKEAYGKNLNKDITKRYGTGRNLLNSYVEEFLWRKMFDGPNVF